MKRETFRYDLRYVYLYRTDGTHIQGIGEESEDGREVYSSTDYFNRMEVIRGNIEKDTLASVWGIWPGSNNGSSSIAAQSYTLYSNEASAEIYGDNSSGQSPFEHKELKYLSIIQIHITPEIFARAKLDTKKKNLEILDPFLKEIKGVMKTFSERYRDNVSMVYYMLASGDFAVVVAGNDPVASFRLSSLLRSRKAVQTLADGTMEEWVLFKTYTLLVSRDKCEEERGSAQAGEVDLEGRKVVIRGCYSSLYWKDYLKCARELERLGLKINMGESLNGRYDFTLTLLEAQYEEYEEMLQSGKLSDSMDPEVKWLGYLSLHKYLSYINRRLLIGNNTAEEMKKWIQADFSASADSVTWRSVVGKEKIETVVERNVDALLELYKRIDGRIGEIHAYRKNLRHNLHLFEKLIRQCRSINAVSDTRIYAVVIQKQIYTALCSLEEYLDVYESKSSWHDAEILDEITSYLQESVRSINVYADYIRNNNLQTLQMPNYNAETCSSLEKLLIGYSEFVHMIYESVSDQNMMSIKKVVPIVVPALEEEVVSVEVMFADGTGKDWKEEEQYHNLEEKLVILKSPTQTELSHMSTMTFSLLHETAHQLRFELQNERNKTVCAMFMDKAAQELANTWRERFQSTDGNADFGEEIRELIEECVKDVYFNAFWGDPDKQMGDFCLKVYEKTPLTFFQKAMEAVFTGFFQSYEPRKQPRANMKDYLKEFSGYYHYENKALSDKLAEIEAILEEMEETAVSDPTGIVREKVYELIQKINEYHKEIEKTALTDIAISKTDERDKIRQELRGITRSFIERIQRCWLGKSDFEIAKQQQEYLHSQLFNAMHTRWEEKHREKMRSGAPAVSWSLFGRWCWIDEDTESNRKEFDRMLRQVSMHSRHQICGELFWTIGQYREETADIFMCRAGEMSFSDYVALMIINVRGEPQLGKRILERMVHVLVSVWCEANTLWEDASQKCMEVVATAEADLESVFVIEPPETWYASGMDGEDRQKILSELKDLEIKLQTLRQELTKKYKALPELQVEDNCGKKELDPKKISGYRVGLEKLGKLYGEARTSVQRYIEFCGMLGDTAGKRSASRALKKVRHYIKLMAVMDQLLQDINRQIHSFLSREEYSVDLRKGAQVYQKERYLKAKSSLAAFDFDSLKPIYPKADQTEGVRSAYNSFCIETLLALFYSQKIRYAQEPEIPGLTKKP